MSSKSARAMPASIDDRAGRRGVGRVVALALCLLAGCASSSLHYSGLVTAAPDDTRSRDVATRRVALRDRVTVVTRADAPDGSAGDGQHAVKWKWYEGQTLITEQSKTLDFAKKPIRFSRSVAASDLGVGHYRVEVLVDGERVDEQVFDVVPN